MSQVVPTGPGWWWVERPGGYKEVTEVWEDVDYDAPRCSPRRGFECSVDDERLVDGVDGCDASDGESVPAIIWLAPVATVEEVERLRAVLQNAQIADRNLRSTLRLHADALAETHRLLGLDDDAEHADIVAAICGLQAEAEQLRAAARSTDATLSALAHEVAQTRGLTVQPRQIAVDAIHPCSEGPTGWRADEDDALGTAYLVRCSISLVPRCAPVVPRAENQDVVADVVAVLDRDGSGDLPRFTCTHWEVRSVTHVYDIVTRAFDRGSSCPVPVHRETHEVPLDLAAYTEALREWARLNRRGSGPDALSHWLATRGPEIMQSVPAGTVEVTL